MSCAVSCTSRTPRTTPRFASWNHSLGNWYQYSEKNHEPKEDVGSGPRERCQVLAVEDGEEDGDPHAGNREDTDRSVRPAGETNGILSDVPHSLR